MFIYPKNQSVNAQTSSIPQANQIIKSMPPLWESLAHRTIQDISERTIKGNIFIFENGSMDVQSFNYTGFVVANSLNG